MLFPLGSCFNLVWDRDVGRFECEHPFMLAPLLAPRFPLLQLAPRFPLIAPRSSFPASRSSRLAPLYHFSLLSSCSSFRAPCPTLLASRSSILALLLAHRFSLFAPRLWLRARCFSFLCTRPRSRLHLLALALAWSKGLSRNRHA